MTVRPIAGPLACWLACLLATPLQAEVVINEIFYHAPDELDDLEFVEIANSGESTVDLSGWKLQGEVRFEFPRGSQLKAGDLFVLAKDAELLAEFYDCEAFGVYKKSLSNRGGELRLMNAQSQLMDSVTYSDRAPWPVAADGYSASIERICLAGPSDQARNWAPSRLSKDYSTTPAGSPGKANSVAAAVTPPGIKDVQFNQRRIAPGESLQVSVEFDAANTIRETTVEYYYAEPGKVGETFTVAMERKGDVFAATLPAGEKENRLLRFHINALDSSGGRLRYPQQNDIRPELSVYVNGTVPVANIPVADFLFVDEDAFEDSEDYLIQQFAGGGRYGRRGFGGPRGYGNSAPGHPLLPQGGAALLLTDPTTHQTTVYDFVNITARKSGWKVRLHKDHMLQGMNTINFLYEPHEATILNESLAYQLYGLAGNHTYQSGYMRVAINGAQLGHFLYFEQPNGNFLRRHKVDNSGDLYKLIWTGDAQSSSRVPQDERTRRYDITRRYEKKSNRHRGDQDLVAVIEKLERCDDDQEMWKLIQQHFEVNQLINYFAVNSLLSHWDGFFNNYFAYYDRKGTGKWSLYPWDQDSTWSQRGGFPDELYEMPIFFGAEGATPDGIVKPDRSRNAFSRGGRPRGFGGPPGFGRRGRGYGWWRDGGDFSRPLLANPSFYQRYLKRLTYLNEEVFTEAIFGSRLEKLQSQLRPEVRLRAENASRDEQGALRELDTTVNALRRHLEQRSRFVSNEIAKAK